MQLISRSVSTRAQAAFCALAVTVGLTVAPALLEPAGASSSRSAAPSTECAAAQAAMKQAKRQQQAAKAKVLQARKALRKATKAHRPAKVRKAKKALRTANARYRVVTSEVQDRQSRLSFACASPTSTVRAVGTGKKLNLLGLASGLDVGAIDLAQLTTLLEQLLPGVTEELDPSRLTALLGGFNSGSDLDPSDALALLGGVFSPTQITSLLGGAASSELLADLAEHLLGQVSGLAGGFPIPSGFDPTDLFDAFAGIFGGLGADQLGGLLAMLTEALGSGGSAFDVDQLTDLLESLVPGLSESFDAGQLTSMLGALNGGGLSAETLSNLLGGQFSPAQLTSVLAGTASPALLGAVIAQVMAQLATAGGGGLELPGALGLEALTDLIGTVTDLLGAITGGGGVLPVVCGLIPIPVLCP